MTSSERNQLISDAAQALALLAKAVRADGDTDYAETLFRQGANLELASPELQACWGGAFNGQSGRQAIVAHLLSSLKPAAVVETGTFRGISTAWLAQHYSGPIFSCETERLYQIQAEKRLEGVDNVALTLGDSRQFLRELMSQLPTDRSVFFYLDAHWYLDLPLKEELQIIFDSPCHPVILIDDFNVPDDPGYSWDDYGPGKALDVTLLAEVLPPSTPIYFPTLPSGSETNARRGCCVVVREGGVDLTGSPLLRSGALSGWVDVAARSPAGASKAENGTRADGGGAPEVFTSAADLRLQNILIGIAHAVSSSLLSPIPPGSDAEEDAAWGPFLTAVRTGLAPLRPGLIERDAPATSSALAEIPYLRGQNAHLVDALKRAQDNEAALHTLLSRQAMQAESSAQKAAEEIISLQQRIDVVSNSRWITIGKRFGFTRLGRHL